MHNLFIIAGLIGGLGDSGNPSYSLWFFYFWRIKIPELMKGIGKGVRGFKEGFKRGSKTRYP